MYIFLGILGAIGFLAFIVFGLILLTGIATFIYELIKNLCRRK